MRVVHFAQVVLGGGNAQGWGRASVMPDPVPKAKTSARRSAFTRTGRLRPASEDIRARTGSVGSALGWVSMACKSGPQLVSEGPPSLWHPGNLVDPQRHWGVRRGAWGVRR